MKRTIASITAGHRTPRSVGATGGDGVYGSEDEDTTKHGETVKAAEVSDKTKRRSLMSTILPRMATEEAALEAVREAVVKQLPRRRLLQTGRISRWALWKRSSDWIGVNLADNPQTVTVWSNISMALVACMYKW